MTRGVVAVLPCAIAMTLGVVANGCADPTGDYVDFLGLVTDRANAVPPASDQCLGTATSETVDLTGTFAAYCPVMAKNCFAAMLCRCSLNNGDFSFAIRCEMVDCDHRWYAELADILYMANQIDRSALNGVNIFDRKVRLRNTAIHLQRPHSGNDDNSTWAQIGLTTLDIEKFFGAQICAKTCLGDYKVTKRESGPGRDH